MICWGTAIISTRQQILFTLVFSTGFLLCLITLSVAYILGWTPLHERSAHRLCLYLYNAKHSQETDIPAPEGIRTRNLSHWSVTDLRLRPRGHRLTGWNKNINITEFIRQPKANVSTTKWVLQFYLYYTLCNSHRSICENGNAYL